METIILVFIILTLLGVLYFNISWANGMRRKLEHEKQKTADLRCKLEEKRCELMWTKARADAGDCHSVRLRNDEIEALKEKLKAEQHRSAKLEKMLMQKWREANDADI